MAGSRRKRDGEDREGRGAANILHYLILYSICIHEIEFYFPKMLMIHTLIDLGYKMVRANNDKNFTSVRKILLLDP
jgi:hypothetical protein